MVACVWLGIVFLRAIRQLATQPIGKVGRNAAWWAAGVALKSAVSTGQGVHTPSLGNLSLFVCLVTVLAGVRSGLYLALACAFGVVSGGVGLNASAAHRPTTPNAQARAR